MDVSLGAGGVGGLYDDGGGVVGISSCSSSSTGGVNVGSSMMIETGAVLKGGEILMPYPQPCFIGGDQPSLTAAVGHQRQSFHHVCSVCGHKARDKTDLRKHYYIHTGEKPYHCPHCPYQARQSSSLYSHIKKKHIARLVV